MAEQTSQGHGYHNEDWTPEEQSAVFERAAKLQSEDAFADDAHNLDRPTLDRSAGRAGIDSKYVRRAVEELRKEEQEAEQQRQALAQAKLQRQRMLRKIAVPAAVVIGLYGVLSYSTLNNKAAAVERQQAQLETQLERRHNLIPNLITSSKFAAAHEKEVFNSLAQLQKQAANAPNVEQRAQLENQLSETMREALNTLRDDSSGSRIFLRLSDEMAGAENRIAFARKGYNDAVVEYNRTARTFPLFIVRPLLGFPAQKPSFKADTAARETPRF